jgi:hypothetical protein
MPKPGEREPTSEEVLLRSDLQDAFQENASLVAIGYTQDASVAVEVLSGWLGEPIGEASEALTLARVANPEGGLTTIMQIIKFDEEIADFVQVVVIVEDTGATMLLPTYIEIEDEGLFRGLRDSVGDAEWDAELSQADAIAFKGSLGALLPPGPT